MQERRESGQLNRTWFVGRGTVQQRSVFVDQPIELLTFHLQLLTELIRHAEVRLLL